MALYRMGPFCVGKHLKFDMSLRIIVIIMIMRKIICIGLIIAPSRSSCIMAVIMVMVDE